jgi:colanic acid biosynthesis glycosyl transferase WcaI
MRVLYMVGNFPPEIGAGPHVIYELGESLVGLGHEVTVLTCFPRYNVPVMPECYRGHFAYREQMGGMEVVRIAAPNYYGKTWSSRAMVQLLSPPVLGLRGLFMKRPDVLITTSPPILTPIMTRMVALRFGIPSVVWVHDLFPQTIVDMGMMQNRTVIRIFEGMERFVYQHSHMLGFISDGHRRYAINRGADPERTRTVANWVNVDEIRPGERQNAFRQTHGLGDQFVVLFAGTMNRFQGLDTIVAAARKLVDEPGLLFLLVGDGIDRERIEREAAGLTNVRFLPMQPKELYPEVLAAADVGLLCLHPAITTPTSPGKLGTIMAAGRPVIASVPKGAGEDVPNRVTAAQCGRVTPAGDADALAVAVLELKRSPELARQMGINGRAYAEAELRREVSVARFNALLSEAVEQYRSQGKKSNP